MLSSLRPTAGLGRTARLTVTALASLLAMAVATAVNPHAAGAAGLAAGIAVDKTGPATATAGELLTYDLAVVNTGGTSFAEGNVKLTDTVVSGGACSGAPAVPKSRNGDTSPSELNPGETWIYQCQVQTTGGDTRVTNKADVSATDTAGTTVTATDTVETTLVPPASRVSPAAAVSGRARMTGAVGCVATRYARATVRGSNILQVTFFVNGKVVTTLMRPNSGDGYQLKYRTASLQYGSYRVRAEVRFVAGARPLTRTLDLRFNRCRPRVIRPTFTG